MMNSSSYALLVIVFCGCAFAAEDLMGSRHAAKDQELSDDNGTGKLYFTGPGYTINLIPQAILLGLLSFLAVYFLGLDLFGSGGSAPSGYGAPAYGAPEPSYGAPAPSYSAPASGYDAPSSSYSASGRYYDTYSQANADSLNGYEDTRRKRSAF